MEDAAENKKIDTCRRVESENRSDRTEYRSHVGAHDEGTITIYNLKIGYASPSLPSITAVRFMKIVKKMDEMISAQPPVDYTTYQTFLKTDFMKFKSHYSGIEWNSLVSRLTRIYIFYEHCKDIFTTRTFGKLARLRLT